VLALCLPPSRIAFKEADVHAYIGSWQAEQKRGCVIVGSPLEKKGGL
jgi:hypothetical protein